MLSLYAFFHEKTKHEVSISAFTVNKNPRIRKNKHILQSLILKM